jgi:DNA/RNA endonuclease YhcR with UshA esterase domain
MMAEKTLYLALCISITGLLILTYASSILEPPLSRIGSINSNSIGKNLHVAGDVSGVHKFKGGSILLTLGDATGKIDVYVGYSAATSMPSLAKAKRLEVIGEVDEYEGRLEIKPEKPGSLKIIS